MPKPSPAQVKRLYRRAVSTILGQLKRPEEEVMLADLGISELRALAASSDCVVEAPVLPLFLSDPIRRSSQLYKALKDHPGEWVFAWEEGMAKSSMHLFAVLAMEGDENPAAMMRAISPNKRGLIVCRVCDGRWMVAIQVAALAPCPILDIDLYA